MHRFFLALAAIVLLFGVSTAQAGEPVRVCEGNSCRLVDRPIVRVATAPVRAVAHVAAVNRCCRQTLRCERQAASNCCQPRRTFRLFRRRCCN